jgi:hypothetical protein
MWVRYAATEWPRSKRCERGADLPSSVTDNLHAQTTASLSCVARDSLGPTRRVELPLDGLRDRYTTVVLRGQRVNLSSSRRSESNRPVPVWRTELSPGLTGLAVLRAKHLLLESPSALLLRSVTHRVHRVGFEPTCCPGKSRVQSSFATDASRATLTRGPCQDHLATHSSHPLESNQNLSGFSRARRPTTQEWVTSAAHLSDRAQRRSSSSFFSCQRAARAGRTSGLHAFAFSARAPRASMHSPLTRAHPSRFEIWIRDRES